MSEAKKTIISDELNERLMLGQETEQKDWLLRQVRNMMLFFQISVQVDFLPVDEGYLHFKNTTQDNIS